VRAAAYLGGEPRVFFSFLARTLELDAEQTLYTTVVHRPD
jgi:hypothetical protein